MTNQEIKQFIECVNQFTNINSSTYKEVKRILPLLDCNSKEDKEILLLAKNKGLI